MRSGGAPTWPATSGAHFPIPRLSEGFFDEIVSHCGGQRIAAQAEPGVQSADYIVDGAVAELKILEEEGLLKPGRQQRIAELMSKSGADRKTFKAIEDAVREPIQGAVRKAARQLAESRRRHVPNPDLTVLLAVNSGYSSIPPELFKRLVLRSCRHDTSQIDFAVTISVHYHQGDFDAYVFVEPEAIPVKEGARWVTADRFIAAVAARYEHLMTRMMSDQMNPELWKQHLPPVRDIVFERDGVRYVRAAPTVPDSRYSSNE